jgi:fumarate hydratase class II
MSKIKKIEEKFRIEFDAMGKIRVPKSAYWGAQTQRAIENFPISGIRFPKKFIETLGMIKMVACKTNMHLGMIDKKLGDAIIKSSSEVMLGKLHNHFPLNIFQTGSATSTNMNANEVIAHRANEILGEKIIHPNNHVNLGQSSNDVIPTCMHITSLLNIENNLLKALNNLQIALETKTKDFNKIIKLGRTHLQDALPIRLGQEFSGYASMIKHGIKRIENCKENLSELAIGGTAVGTGVNTHPKFANLFITEINKITKLKFKEAENHFEAQSARDAIVELSGELKVVAISLFKIANDIRWLASGPRSGIGELVLPSLQPGSSIMPGKVNPIIAEVVMQVAAKVIGNDTSITIGGLTSNFELNTMMPILTHSILQSIDLLNNAANIFVSKCIENIKPNEKRCKELALKSLSLATILTPRIGYDRANEIAKEAFLREKTIKEIVLEKNILSKEEVEKLFDLNMMA